MDNGGDTVVELPVDEAIDRIKMEMGKGRWLRVVDAEGLSDSITDPTDPILADRDRARALLTNASELGLVAALIGG
jgi:hypothetical protein